LRDTSFYFFLTIIYAILLLVEYVKHHQEYIQISIVVEFHVVNADEIAMSVSLGIGGFSMGAAAALHSAACYAHGRFTNGIAYPINLRVVVGLSGWLPCSRCDFNLLISGKHGYVNTLS